MTPWRWEVRQGSFPIAEVTSLAAADAVERLCGGETHVARWSGSDGRQDYGSHVTLDAPMTDGECEAWLNKVAGVRGCAYCGGKHTSDRCLDVRQSEARRWR